MDIKIIGDNINITEAMESYVKNKFLTLPIPNKLQSAEFRVNIIKNVQKVSFSSHFNNKDHFIENKGSSFYEATDLLIDKIKREFVKSKEQSQQKHVKLNWNELQT